MKRIYFDHNIYIHTLYNVYLFEFLRGLSVKNAQCLYSPAHIEEIYKVAVDNTSRYSEKMDELLRKINEITNGCEVFPTQEGLIFRQEDPLQCYERVRFFDTRNIVEEHSTQRFNIDSQHYKNMLSEDKHNQSVSNIEYDKIWDYSVVRNILQDMQNNIDMLIDRNNSSPEVQLWRIIGIDKTLPESFDFKKGNYSHLKTSHNELEYTMESLFRILNYSGYYADKDKRTSVSGTHDVSHAIYATKADCLFSTDKRFVQKCKAVYYFIGINTQVYHCDFDNILVTIKKAIES